ncbi:hypothetical protein [Lacticaseibacillus saniviri]|uniref:hypothetical protein n=1 Tax=Lacticaseibacillus saniviri TaxID=931533 RepID=UPI0007051D64|nr:hypothetical protein [Lacticaseibacillus saniviri]MCG4283063.1 hypothetical protein [Lacticaseibacillus saniviri]
MFRLIVFVVMWLALWPGIPTRADTSGQAGLHFSYTEDTQPKVPGVVKKTRPTDTLLSGTELMPRLSNHSQIELVWLGAILVTLNGQLLYSHSKKRSR